MSRNCEATFPSSGTLFSRKLMSKIYRLHVDLFKYLFHLQRRFCRNQSPCSTKSCFWISIHFCTSIYFVCCCTTFTAMFYRFLIIYINMFLTDIRRQFLWKMRPPTVSTYFLCIITVFQTVLSVTELFP